MSDSYRMERIERLLNELRYEVEIGMIKGEIEDETMCFAFYVPISKQIPKGVVQCEFRTRPIPFINMPVGSGLVPKLEIIKGGRS